jgi:hypothetical protein
MNDENFRPREEGAMGCYKLSKDNLKKIITYLSHMQSIDLLTENLEHDDYNRPLKGHTQGKSFLQEELSA